MRILITGAAGFVGTSLAHALRSAIAGVDLIGIDNLSRAGSETNRSTLRALGVRLVHGDLRLASDVEALPAADWVIDAAANPSVLAGIDGRSSPRQLVEHNLGGTVHLPPQGEYVARGAARQAAWALSGGSGPPAWEVVGTVVVSADPAPAVRFAYASAREALFPAH